MQIEPFKIRVTPEESKVVQEVLFKNGYTWCTGYKNISTFTLSWLYLYFKYDKYDKYSENPVLFWGGDSNSYVEYDIPELTFQQFKEKYMKEYPKWNIELFMEDCKRKGIEFKEEFVLPEKWYCLPKTLTEAKILGKWFDDNREKNNILEDNFYEEKSHIIIKMGVSVNYGFGKAYDAKQITFEQFEKYVLNKQEEMELKITKEKVLAAAKKCSQAKDVLKEMFPEVFEEDKYLNLTDESISSLLYAKTTGNLAGKAFHLRSSYNWEIVKDFADNTCLVPTKKQ
jgi:hypothetical protein